MWLAGDPDRAARPSCIPACAGCSSRAPGSSSGSPTASIDDARIWTSAAGAYGETVADHALALLHAGRRRLAECARAQRWDRRLGGPAAVRRAPWRSSARARSAARSSRLLAPWRCHVIAVTRSGREVEGADGVRRRRPSSTSVWPRADVVVVAAPATDATRRLVGAPELAALPPDAWLVNVARGTLVDTDALVEALAAGRIGGAALDVTDPEPLPDGHPLWREPRALITPHVANTDGRPPARAGGLHARERRPLRPRRGAARRSIDTGRGY